MTLFTILASIFILLIYLMYVPITVCIDTLKNEYYINIQGLTKASIERHEKELFRIKLKLLFLNYYIYPLKKKRSVKQKKIKKLFSLNKVKHLKLSRILKLVKTFKIKRFFIDIDTGHFILNARLYPLFALLNYNNGNYHINFQGRNQMVLHLKNRPIRIIKSFINF